MNYLIQAYQNDKQLLGTSNASLVYDAKTMVKVDNALKRFNPDKVTTVVKVFSYTNLYNESSYKLVKTVSVSF
jgi:hypothetical protein